MRSVSPFEKPRKQALKFEELKGSVEIQVDRDQIKHIFAENDEDAYFAQGYTIASDRLWEMDFIVRLASGRLSEVVGRQALEMDKFFVRIGLSDAARESSEIMLQDSLTGPALRAYTKGVNAFIRSLDPSRLPFEFRILGYAPEDWTLQKTALIGKFMSFYLSGYTLDLPLTRSRWILHRSEFDDLFPLRPLLSEPVIPRGTAWSFDTPRVHPPATEFKPDMDALQPLPRPEPGNGSNNWAVSGKKSTTGFPILSSDIHLGLQLPSLWYEIQIVTPSQNVYGTSLVGVPGVMNGFNSKVSWAVTNGYTDILDWYQLRFRDEKQSEYLFEKEWRPVISHEATIRIKGEEPLKLALRRTHFGPVVYEAGENPSRANVPRGLAMRWAALEPANELKAFLAFNHAKTIAECRKGLDDFNSPDQNFLFADSSGAIGLWHMGKFPVKWPGQGRMISDGTSSTHEWGGWIPRDQVPQVKNPTSGFLSSANQWPTDERYPYYLGSNFMPPFRAIRINEVLKSKPKLSPEDFISLQGDSLSVLARMALPALLGSLSTDKQDEATKKILSMLKSWDYRFTETSSEATIFDRWFAAVVKRLWSPYFPNATDYQYPSVERTLELITSQPQSKWFDNPKTPEKETLTELSEIALKDALAELKKEFGSKPSKWQWASVTPTRFTHLTRVSGLGRELSARGHSSAVFANTGVHGPAWKMVVALGPKPKAWGVYPGGQSGDPTSPYYDTFLKSWAKNELRPLNFLNSKSEKNANHELTIHLEPEKPGSPK